MKFKLKTSSYGVWTDDIRRRLYAEVGFKEIPVEGGHIYNQDGIDVDINSIDNLIDLHRKFNCEIIVYEDLDGPCIRLYDDYQE